MFKKYNNSYYDYYCNYLFPMAIEYGMSADEFWKDDPQLFVAYRTYFFNKKKREKEELDYKCWLQGLYIHDGNGKLNLSLKQFIGNMFSKSPNNSKIDSYPNKPYSELEKDKKTQIEKQKKSIYQKEQNSLIYQGSIKQIYLERMNKK